LGVVLSEPKIVILKALASLKGERMLPLFIDVLIFFGVIFNLHCLPLFIDVLIFFGVIFNLQEDDWKLFPRGACFSLHQYCFLSSVDFFLAL